MQQDAQEANEGSQQQSSNISVREEMEGVQYGDGGWTVPGHGFFGIDPQGESSARAEKQDMNTGAQQQPAVTPEYHGDDNNAAFPEDRDSMVGVSEDGTAMAPLGEQNKETAGDVAVEREPGGIGEAGYQDLGLDLRMGEREQDAEMRSLAPRDMTELSEMLRGAIANDEPGCQGLQGAVHIDLTQGGHGIDVDTGQVQHEATVRTNEGFALSEDPAATTAARPENESQYPDIYIQDHEGPSEQRYGGGMAPGTAGPLLGLGGGETDQPSTYTSETSSRYNREAVMPGYEDTTVDTNREQAFDRRTPPRATVYDFWMRDDMDDIECDQAFQGGLGMASKSGPSQVLAQNPPRTFATSSSSLTQFKPPAQPFSQQQPLSLYNQSGIDPAFALKQQQLQAQIAEKRRQVEDAKRLYEQRQRRVQPGNTGLGFAPNQAGLPAPFLTGPLSYQRAPPNGYQQPPSLGFRKTSQRPPVQSDYSLGQTMNYEPPASYPTKGQQTTSQPLHPNKPVSAPAPDEDDDEPLITRTKRRTSIPSPSPPHSPDAAPSTPIDWKLPQYDIQLQPTTTSPSSTTPSLPVAKISLPGLVREELLLSPDHATQETHLLLHVFLPAQRALRTPDPHPAVAVLNFHTIALMVIEAYVQYEIGDELGRANPYFMSAGNGAGNDAAGRAKAGKGSAELEYARIRDARSADVDDVFFAVVDRWRAGRESGKQSLKMIRGVQEFCDVALDVIFYVKEHGLLGAEAEGEGGEGGTEGGPESGNIGVSGEGEEDEGKGKQKGKQQDGIAVLQARPKAKRGGTKDKAEAAPRKRGKKGEAEEGKKRKRGAATVGVTVVKR